LRPTHDVDRCRGTFGTIDCGSAERVGCGLDSLRDKARRSFATADTFPADPAGGTVANSTLGGSAADGDDELTAASG